MIGCRKTSNHVENEIPQSIIDEVELLSLTPDSLLTPNQLSKKISIYKIIKETTKIDGDKLTTTATTEDFEQKGLSKYYYYYYLKNLEEINSTMDYNPRNIKEVYDEMMQGLDAFLNNSTLTDSLCN